MARFIGFSTKNKQAINHTLTGKELVVEDLLNNIMTRKGERIMMPTYGSMGRHIHTKEPCCCL